MKRKVVWMVVSGWMAAALLLTSCAPAVVGEEPGKVAPKQEVPKKEVVPKEVVAEEMGPQYGGVLTIALNAELSAGFRNSDLARTYNRPYHVLVNEQLVGADRLKGPAGTGERTGMVDGFYPPINHLTGKLAESWEIIQPDTIVYTIRQGVHWQNKPPVNGAELTAEDVVYTYMMLYGREGSRWPIKYNFLSNSKNPAESVYIDPEDPWKVIFKAKPGRLSQLWQRTANYTGIFPKAAISPIEGEGFGDWKGVVGTGPFILTDRVAGSALTWERNPDYWQKDVFYPENQLPYIDSLRILIIPDASTQRAALRTGRIDHMFDVQAEHWRELNKYSPELLAKPYPGRGPTMHMRNDVKPFDDIKVRQAMMMAIDHPSLVKDYYEGSAEPFWYPTFPQHEGFFVPLEEMPEVVQQMWGYHPDKAKELLAEAGYPDGFTTSVVVWKKNDIDLLSVIKAYWEKVGVTLELRVKDETVAITMGRSQSYEHGIMDISGVSGPVETSKLTRSRFGGEQNYAMVNDPFVEKTNEAFIGAYFDPVEHARIVREATPELQRLAHHIKFPAPQLYSVWQPWVKGYHGEIEFDYHSDMMLSAYYVWIDQNLKQEMTGRK